MESHSPSPLAQIFSNAWAVKVRDMSADFFKLEAAGGILLVFFSALALIVANSPLEPIYHYVLYEVDFGIGFKDLTGADFNINKSVLMWINDGLMVIFFFLVGLELKREITVGTLSDKSKIYLPVVTAAGGMAVPALIYWFINQDSPETISGWAIPCATDIAFALGILSLLGSRVPISLKILLTAFAIMDDLGSIIVIALFYSDGLNFYALFFGFVPIFGLFILNKSGVVRPGPYIFLGIILWISVLESGVHAVLAGVVTALFIPVRVEGERRSPCQRLEHDLHPWVAFIILPIFGFANAGVPFDGMGFSSFLEPTTLGIILGLIIGKQIGIFGSILFMVKSGLSAMPERSSWAQIYAIAVLSGIGFTMSLFIGGLAFEGAELQAEVRLGVLTGSLISAVAGYLLLKKTCGGPADETLVTYDGRFYDGVSGER
jgi:NhaA family Na+:H+ antiporter